MPGDSFVWPVCEVFFLPLIIHCLFLFLFLLLFLFLFLFLLLLPCVFEI